MFVLTSCSLRDDDIVYLFLQKQKIALSHIPRSFGTLPVGGIGLQHCRKQTKAEAVVAEHRPEQWRPMQTAA